MRRDAARGVAGAELVPGGLECLASLRVGIEGGFADVGKTMLAPDILQVSGSNRAST